MRTRVTQFVHSLENDQSNPGAHVYTYSKGPEKCSQVFEQKWKFARPLKFCLIEAHYIDFYYYLVPILLVRWGVGKMHKTKFIILQ